MSSESLGRSLSHSGLSWVRSGRTGRARIASRLAPSWATACSPGREPRESGPQNNPSPGGRQRGEGLQPRSGGGRCAPTRGLGVFWAPYPGLTPRATRCRPTGLRSGAASRRKAASASTALRNLNRIQRHAAGEVVHHGPEPRSRRGVLATLPTIPCRWRRVDGAEWPGSFATRVGVCLEVLWIAFVFALAPKRT